MGHEADADAAPGAPELTAVRFVDLRFLYDSALIQGRNHPPLSGTVVSGRRWERGADEVRLAHAVVKPGRHTGATGFPGAGMK